jgi:Na+/H+ antiporter NhaD/arsenite permease-like protein
MQDYYNKNTPMEAGAKVFLVLYIDIASKSEVNVYQYIVSSLNYLATYTKVDIAFAIGVLSQFLSNPSL